MNRRALLKGAGAAAVAIPLAPIAALLVPPTQVLPSTAWKLGYSATYRAASVGVLKSVAWLPISEELLADSIDVRELVDARLRTAFAREVEELLG